MIICQAYKFRLKTNSNIEQKLVHFAGCCRFVWNKALELIKYRLAHHRPILWYNDLAHLLKLWKKSEEYGFLSKAHSQILQQTLKDLEKAIKSAFTPNNGINFPKFKKKYLNDTFRYPQGVKIEGNRIYLPKIGWICFYKSREIEGKIKQVTVKREFKFWFVSIVVEKEIFPAKRTDNPVGIDLGVKNICTLSSGEYIEPLDLSKLEKKLVREQRRLSRKKKFSKNWYKQKSKISSLWYRIKNKRYDYLHKLTTTIAKNHGIVVMEDLRIKNMTKSARGTIDNPGHNVRQKTGLNRSILRQSWGILKRLLEYKLEFSGGELRLVDPKYTSLECPVCGHVDKNNRKSQSLFVCQSCGYKDNADHVASINILSRGYLPQGMREVKPVEYARVHMMKQEPAGIRKEVPLPV